MTASDKNKEQNRLLKERLRQKAFIDRKKAEGKTKCHWYLTIAAKKAVDEFMDSQEFINQLKDK